MQSIYQSIHKYILEYILEVVCILILISNISYFMNVSHNVEKCVSFIELQILAFTLLLLLLL